MNSVLALEERSKSLVVTSLAHFVNDGSLYTFITLYSVLLPLKSELGYIGILVGILNLFSVIASPLVGRIADRKRNHGRLLSLGLFLISIGIVGYSLSSIFTSGFSLFLVLIPFAIIAGVGSCFYHPLGASVLHDKWKSGSIGRAMGINGSIGSAGRSLYPFMVTALVVYLTIPSVTVLAVVAFGTAVIIFRTLGPMKFGGKDEAESESPDTSRQKTNGPTLQSILPKILPLTILSFIKGFAMFSITSFALSYLQHVSGVQSTLERGAIFTLILGMAIVGQPVLGNIADKFGRRLVLGISVIAASVGILIMLNASNLYVQVVFFMVFGFFGLTGFPLIMPLASGAVPKEATTLSNSIVWGVGNVGGGAIGPVVIGILATPAFFGSLVEPFYIAAVLSILSLVMLPFVPKPKPKVRVAA